MDAYAESRTEQELIKAVLSGETQLYHDLIRPHERSVYRMALSYMKNETEAEDVAQEALIKAYRNLGTFRGEAKFGTWLISITLNEARNRLRRQSLLRLQSLDAGPDDDGTISPALLRDWREIPSEAVERDEVRALLKSAVDDLPEMFRAVFLLREVEELSVIEAAEVLQISVSNVKVRLHRARMMLQKRLAPQLKTVCSAPKAKRRWLPW